TSEEGLHRYKYRQVGINGCWQSTRRREARNQLSDREREESTGRVRRSIAGEYPEEERPDCRSSAAHRQTSSFRKLRTKQPQHLHECSGVQRASAPERAGGRT